MISNDCDFFFAENALAMSQLTPFWAFFGAQLGVFSEVPLRIVGVTR